MSGERKDLTTHDLHVLLVAMQKDLHHLTQTTNKLEREVDGLTVMAARWKGGFLVLLGIGGFLGTVLTLVMQKFIHTP